MCQAVPKSPLVVKGSSWPYSCLRMDLYMYRTGRECGGTAEALQWSLLNAIPFLHLILTATARQIAFVAVVSGSEHQGLVIRIELVEYSCIRAVVMHCARALGTQEEEESVGSSDWRRYPQSLHHPQHRTQAKTLHEPDTTGGGYANPTTAKFCNECGN